MVSQVERGCSGRWFLKDFMDGSESSLAFLLFIQIVLIALNAVFACLEIAFISTNEQRLTRLARRGDRRARRLLGLSKQPARFLATIQVAITLSGFLGSAFAADHFAEKVAPWLEGLPFSAGTLDTFAVILITLMLSYVTLVFGELVPKRLAMQRAEELSLGLSGLLWTVDKFFRPLVWLLTVSTNGVLRMCGIDPHAEKEPVSEEEIRMMVDAGSEGGSIDSEEKEFIQNVFEFDDLTAGEIATHRTELEVLFLEDTDETWAQTIFHSRHSRYPICDGRIDKVIGVLSVKDWFRLTDKSRENVMSHVVRTPVFVSEHTKADVLFRNMKQNRTPFVVVCDEYGGVQGVLTMSDLVEQLVGDISDDDEVKAEEEQPDIVAVEPGVWKVQGKASLDDVSKALDVALVEEGCDTFGGFILGHLGEIPEEGGRAQLEVAGLAIEVCDIRNRCVGETVVTLLKKPEADADGDDADDDER